MRIRRLAFAGLGPFRSPQCIDFDALEDVGIYLIAGRTGAGKSTILDAISFALYGSVPRFDGTATRLRSDHSAPEDETFAELDFEAAGRLYRIRRSPSTSAPPSAAEAPRGRRPRSRCSSTSTASGRACPRARARPAPTSAASSG
ncbi:AAA family ATPase [Rathayibacter oskolensis]|uniref:AAA family ATPase n=1 Tax=Rathayibacter oskolensis TaxID=1891671 RepID=UPI00265F932E|nr:AAA family ATPase [Rathayibacter oskolensis]WKK71648.1 AAA family ATPase [Rathayibacter oskolensis]